METLFLRHGINKTPNNSKTFSENPHRENDGSLLGLQPWSQCQLSRGTFLVFYYYYFDRDDANVALWVSHDESSSKVLE